MNSMVVVVPWFSKEEWLETYKAAFCDDVCRWRDAKDTMLVWQARVEKLPAGIDVTLPLLQAKIVEADPTVENAVKSIFLASALQRFVTSIVKLPQTNYYRAQSMHNLALEIGLPMHLVDLRNEIVHGHGGWAGGETVHKALEVAYKWIKGYYWDAELEKMHSNQSGISPEEWEDFLLLLKDYTKLIISFAKKKRSAYLKVKKGLIQSVVSLYSLDPEECMKAIVAHVLLPEASSGLAKHLGSVDICKCGCCIDGRVLERVEPLLASLCEIEEGTELLLSHLIKRGQEYSKLSSEWICLISGALLELKCFCSQEYHCASHSVMIEEPREGVDWKRVVVELLEVQAEWSTDIAFKIMDSARLRITDEQKKKIKDLVYLFNESSKVPNGRNNKNCSQKGDLYTVDNILSEAQHLPLGDRRKLERIRISVDGQASDSESVDSPLGVLPHQRDNALLYKELILHYPESDTVTPSNKRRKLQNSLG